MQKLYDFDAWFRQPRTVLRRGVNYETSQSSMYQQIRSAALKRGLKGNDVRIIDTSDGFIIWVAATVLQREAS